MKKFRAWLRLKRIILHWQHWPLIRDQCFQQKKILFSVFRKFLQIFHVVLQSKILKNHFQKSAPASCTKKNLHRNFFCFYIKKNWGFQIFWLFFPVLFSSHHHPSRGLTLSGYRQIGYFTVNANTTPLVKFVSWYCFL